MWYKELKKEKKRTIENLNDEIVASELTEDQVLQKQETLQILKKMQKLEESAREVVYLRTMGNLSFIEIAEILGKTPNWARVTFFRAKQKIKEETEHGFKNRM